MLLRESFFTHASLRDLLYVLLGALFYLNNMSADTSLHTLFGYFYPMLLHNQQVITVSSTNSYVLYIWPQTVVNFAIYLPPVWTINTSSSCEGKVNLQS